MNPKESDFDTPCSNGITPVSDIDPPCGHHGYTGRLAAALVQAQRTAESVTKGAKNQFHGYKYATSESLIDSARDALNAADLAVIVTGWVFHAKTAQDAHSIAEVQPDVKPGEKPLAQPSGRLSIEFLLIHKSGDHVTFHITVPVIPEKGRPQDKAEAASLTYGMGYFLRSLLMISREDEADVEKRDDRPTRVVTPPRSAGSIPRSQNPTRFPVAVPGATAVNASSLQPVGATTQVTNVPAKV